MNAAVDPTNMSYMICSRLICSIHSQCLAFCLIALADYLKQWPKFVIWRFLCCDRQAKLIALSLVHAHIGPFFTLFKPYGVTIILVLLPILLMQLHA